MRVYGYVMATVYQWRKKTWAGGPGIINSVRGDSHKPGYLLLEYQRAWELYLLEWAQKGMKISGARMLATDVVTEEDVTRRRRKLIVIRSTEKNQIEGVYGQTELPVLPRDHPLSEPYMWATDEEGHEGAISTLHRSRRKVWVITGHLLAETI